MCVLRKAKTSDIDSIEALIGIYAKKGIMLYRSKNDICENLRDFTVYTVKNNINEILGTCALHIWWIDLGEIRSLAVRPESCHQGIGTALVTNSLDEAQNLGIKRVFTLTVAKDFFEKLGFVRVQKHSLPQKIWSDCIRCPKFPECDEEALIKYL